MPGSNEVTTPPSKASGSGCVVVVIEALDVVCPCLEPGSSEAHRQAVTTMIDMFDAIHKTVRVSFCCVMFSAIIMCMM